MDKLTFLKTEFPKLLHKLKPDTKGNWGVMNGQQMVEHMAESVSFATGKNNQALHTPAELVPKYKDFAMSDKEFKPNTKNVLLADTAYPLKQQAIQDAIVEYEKEVAAFINYFETHKGATLTNSFFGDLNFEEWVHLLHKHAVHHSKQFGLL
jgi:hypothetical protein